MAREDLTAEPSERLEAHELLKRIVGIVPMQPHQRCQRIDWLLEYRRRARQDALREYREIVARELQLDHNHHPTRFKVQIIGALDKADFTLARLASEGVEG